MEEKELQPLKQESSIKSKFSNVSSRLFAITKLVLGICLVPFVYSATVAFVQEASTLDKVTNVYFAGGIIGFLILYLFIWEPTVAYAQGQKILQSVFKFFAPLVKVAPYLLPIYTILLFVAYAVVALFSKSEEPLRYFVWLFGFSIALHLVFSAKSLRSRKGDFLKSNYIFGFSLIYLINLAILGFGLSIFFEKFSFVNLCNRSCQIAQGIFSGVFKQLFM